MDTPDFVIKVPCSSANLGPGFDVMGLALDIFLELHVSFDRTRPTSTLPINFQLSYEGDGAEDVSLDPDVNLITRVAVYVLRCHDVVSPPAVHVRIVNAIPLGRGLGSSGAAVVAGVELANQVGGLRLTRRRALDYCLMVERHPDNVAAALHGGLVCTYLNELSPEDASRLEVPLSEVLPQPAGGINTGIRPPIPPLDIGHFRKFPWSPAIRCIAVIPAFEVPTAKAREALPATYSRADVTFNAQRVTLLPAALGQSPPDPDEIYLAMQDRLHQPYRGSLVPGLTELLRTMSPASHPGLLGVCLSGAGPTILALATENFEAIAAHIVGQFGKECIECRWELLRPAEDGTTVTEEER